VVTTSKRQQAYTGGVHVEVDAIDTDLIETGVLDPRALVDVILP
jgi:hypothetical protein